MVSLSDDARQFLRDSRNEGSRISESSPLKNGQVESVELQKKEPVRKTLRELALDHRNKNHSLTHSGSCPSLFDPLTSTNHVENSLRNASPSNIRKTCVNNVSSNVDLLVQLDDPPSCTDREDTFVELITQRHSTKLEGLNISDTNQRSEDISISPWVADFN